MRYSVAIIGGGPSGLAAAIALAQRNIDCAVFDGLTPPIDKACGEGLLPNALTALAQLGIHIPATQLVTENDGCTLSGIEFHHESTIAHATFHHEFAIGIRRTRLHETMVARAESLNIPMFWGHPATLATHKSLQYAGETVHFDWLIAADGQTSPLRKRLGLHATTHLQTRYATRQHFYIQPFSRNVEVHWGPRGQIYVTPVATNQVGVTLLTSIPNLALSAALADFPLLQLRLSAAPAASRIRGALTTTRRLRRVHTRSAALIGDASGSSDAITGEGLAVSFHQALALAEAIHAGDLSSYQRAHNRLSALPRRMAALLLALDHHPALRRRTIEVLAANPPLFDKFLQVHLGNTSFSQFVLQNGIHFAARLLLPPATRLQSAPLR